MSISLRYGGEFLKYFAASLLALLVDMAVFSAIFRVWQKTPYFSATCGFMAGMIVTYILSVRWVFAARRYASRDLMEFVIFVLIGVAGLGITQLVLRAGMDLFSVSPEWIKLMAAAVTFVFNFTVRKFLLFAKLTSKVNYKEYGKTNV